MDGAPLSQQHVSRAAVLTDVLAHRREQLLALARRAARRAQLVKFLLEVVQDLAMSLQHVHVRGGAPASACRVAAHAVIHLLELLQCVLDLAAQYFEGCPSRRRTARAEEHQLRVELVLQPARCSPRRIRHSFPRDCY